MADHVGPRRASTQVLARHPGKAPRRGGRPRTRGPGSPRRGCARRYDLPPFSTPSGSPRRPRPNLNGWSPRPRRPTLRKRSPSSSAPTRRRARRGRCPSSSGPSSSACSRSRRRPVHELVGQRLPSGAGGRRLRPTAAAALTSSHAPRMSRPVAMHRALDLVGRPLGMALEHQRGDTGHHRRRHRRPAQADVVAVDDAARAERRRRRCRGQGGHDVRAGGGDVGLCEAVLASRPASTSRREVVRALGVPPSSTAPTEIANGSLPARTRRGAVGGAAVAGRRDDDDAAEVRRLDGCVERIGAVGLGLGRAQRQVDDADVVVVLVVDRELQPVDRVEDRRVPGVVAGLDGDQVAPRRDADVLAAAGSGRRRLPSPAMIPATWVP